MVILFWQTFETLLSHNAASMTPIRESIPR